MATKKRQVAAVDAGNGGVNAVLGTTKGRHKQHYEPSVRAAASGDSLGLGDLELQFTYVDWRGHRYVTGDDVTRVTRRAIEHHIGAQRYGNEFQQFLVANALARLGVKSGAVDLNLFAPPGLYNDVQPTLVDRFQSAPVEIKLKDDKTLRQWEYSSVTVWPEGVGAAACFILDAEGKSDRDNAGALDGEVIVLDAGAYTLDAIKITNGSFNLETLATATWTNGGLDSHLRQPLLKLIKSQSKDFALMTVDDVDRVIRRGVLTEDYTLKAGRSEIDLAPVVAKYRERYAEWIANNIVDDVFSGLSGINAVILVGGGAALIEDFMTKWYSEKVMQRKDYAATKKLHPVDMNAVGGLRLALMQSRAKKSG